MYINISVNEEMSLIELLIYIYTYSGVYMLRLQMSMKDSIYDSYLCMTLTRSLVLDELHTVYVIRIMVFLSFVQSCGIYIYI